MVNAVAKLEEHGEAVTSRALAAAAHISLNTACTWLRQRETGAAETAPALSVLHYSSYSVADTMPETENSTECEIAEGEPATADPPEASPHHGGKSSGCLCVLHPASRPATSCSGATALDPGSVKHAAGRDPSNW